MDGMREERNGVRKERRSGRLHPSSVCVRGAYSICLADLMAGESKY